MTEIFPYLFAILSCSVIGWFFLVHILFKNLKEKHPKKYTSMGSPTLFPQDQANAMNELWAFTKFIFKREWQDLDDSKLAFLGNFMLFYFITYLLGFSFLIALFFLGYAP